MIKFRTKQVFAFIVTVVGAFSISISFTIISSPLVYKLTIPLFGLTDTSELSADQLMENFQVIVNYLLNPTISSLEMPYFPASTVVQLVRIPACHAGGRGFESRPLRHSFKWF